MEFREFVTERRVLALLPIMNSNDCCRCSYHGYGIYIKIVAPRLLEICKTPEAALGTFADYLKTVFPGFKVRGKNTGKGDPLYEPQRLYNKLAYHYRPLESRRKKL